MDDYRAALWKRLNAQHQEAEQLAATAAQRESDLRAKVTAFEARPDAPADACPACWYEHGRTSLMRPIPSGTDVDLFRCSVCGRDEERNA